MRDFKRLAVWRKAHELVLAVYRVTADFPDSELYGLSSQMRRSAASVPTNIAEGCGRGAQGREFARFLQIASGSASELEYQILLSHDLKLLPAEDYAQLSAQTVEVKKMLTSLRRHT